MSNFDRDCNTYNEEGKILQLEYASKAVQSAETIVGVKCLDGIILGAQKLVFSKLLVQGTNRRLYNVDEKLGLAICGKIPDGRHMMDYARGEAKKYYKEFGTPIMGRSLADRLGLYKNAHTLYGSVRPFGSHEIIASYDQDEGLGLFMVEHTGVRYGYTACTAGKGRQIAKAEFQKRNFDKLTCREALQYVAKMQQVDLFRLTLTHEETKEKKYEIELSWITKNNDYVHQLVPRDEAREAEEKALAEIENEQMA